MRRWMGRTAAVTCTVAACAVSGAIISGQTAHLHAHSSALKILPVAGLAFAALLLIITELGTTALIAWIPLSVVLYPLSSHLPGAPIVTFDRMWIVGMLVLLATLAPRVRASKPTRRMAAALGTMAAIFALRALTTPVQTYYLIRLSIDALVLPLILFLLVRRGVQRDAQLTERVAAAMMIAGAILGLIGIAEKFLGFELATLSGSQVRFDNTIDATRVSGPYPVPEPYALVVLMCLAATLYWVQLRGKSRHLVGGVAIALEFGGLAFTLFRVAWIGAVLVVLISVAFRPRQLGRAVAVSIALGLMLLVAFVELSSVPLFAQRVNNTSNVSARFGAYQQAYEIWRMHPFTGVGIAQYQTVAQGLPLISVNGTKSVPNPHDSYLQALAEIGIFGFAALVYLTVATARLIRALNRRRWTQPDALLGACVLGAGVAYLIFSLSLSMLPYDASNEFFAILLGLAAGRVDVLCTAPSRPRPLHKSGQSDQLGRRRPSRAARGRARPSPA